MALLVLATPAAWALAGAVLRLLLTVPSHVCTVSMVAVAVIYVTHTVGLAQTAPVVTSDLVHFASMLPAILLLALYFTYDQRAGFSSAAGRVLLHGADVASSMPATRRLAAISILQVGGVAATYGAMFAAVALPSKTITNPAAVQAGPNGSEGT